MQQCKNGIVSTLAHFFVNQVPPFHSFSSNGAKKKALFCMHPSNGRIHNNKKKRRKGGRWARHKGVFKHLAHPLKTLKIAYSISLSLSNVSNTFNIIFNIIFIIIIIMHTSFFSLQNQRKHRHSCRDVNKAPLAWQWREKEKKRWRERRYIIESKKNIATVSLLPPFLPFNSYLS